MAARRRAWNALKVDVVRVARMEAAVALANQRSKARAAVRPAERPARRAVEPNEQPQQGLQDECQQQHEGPEDQAEGPQQQYEQHQQLHERVQDQAEDPQLQYERHQQQHEDQAEDQAGDQADEDLVNSGFLFQVTAMVLFGICGIVCSEPCVAFSRGIFTWVTHLVVAHIGCPVVFVSYSAAIFLLCTLLSSIRSRHHEKTLKEDRLGKLPLATLVTPRLVSTTATPQAKLVAVHVIQRPNATSMLAMSTLLEYRRRRDLPLLHAKILVGPIHAILVNGTIVYIVHIAADNVTKWSITATAGEVEDGDALLAFEINVLERHHS
ncbi:hypothetical protein AC1031_006479 [Aphanomyces cochlioides]|nr:hypothetical protein AC1031_006479 [Aphanomyces cochlioides]